MNKICTSIKQSKKLIELGIGMMILLVSASCDGIGTESNVQTKREKKECRDTIQVLRGYKVVGDNDIAVEKIIMDGHEYWAVWGRLAGAPAVLHDENCPCKQKQITEERRQ